MNASTAPRAAAQPMSLAVWGQLLLLGLLWGGSFFFARIAVAEMPPLVLVFWRVLIAAAALHLWLRARGVNIRPILDHAGNFVALALLNNVIPFSLIFAGQTEIGAGLASVLNATTPFWTIIVANALTSDEKFSATKISGVLLGIAGTAVMIGPGLLAGLGGPVWAKLAIVGAAVSYAFAVVFAKRFRALPSTLVATGQLTASTLIMLPVMLVFYDYADVFSGGRTTWLAVVALALASTAFAYFLYFSILASAGATNASLVTLIVPATAILLGALVLSERLELFEIGGMVLIAAGLVTIDGRLFARR
ncbi:MAG: DMT family transporter [Rhizobiaceae bacterium]|nr:DMT family transporter [Rhizobiaceae bacterium]